MSTKIVTALFLLSLMAVPAAAANPGVTSACVTAHVLSSNLVNTSVLLFAEETARGLFSEIGISVKWKHSELRNAEEKCVAVQVDFDWNSPANLRPGALAYALPFQHGGTQIHVLIGRLSHCPTDRQRGDLLGYVIAHEIGHVLERVSSHSETGVMKAYWARADYFRMFERSLRFDDEDANLIRKAFSRVP